MNISIVVLQGLLVELATCDQQINVTKQDEVDGRALSSFLSTRNNQCSSLEIVTPLRDLTIRAFGLSTEEIKKSGLRFNNKYTIGNFLNRSIRRLSARQVSSHT